MGGITETDLMEVTEKTDLAFYKPGPAIFFGSASATALKGL